MAGTGRQMDLFGGGGGVPDSGTAFPAAASPSESSLPPAVVGRGPPGEGRAEGAGTPGFRPPPVLTPTQLLAALRERGATGLQRVRFRRNRTVLWSLTDRGRTLNLHEAYAAAPAALLDAFALLAGTSRDAEGRRRAARRVREWPPVVEAIGRVREAEVVAAMAVAEGRPPSERTWPGAAGTPMTPPCVGGPVERSRILALYRRLNAERFGGCLPDEVPLRLSGRMRRRLGHMRPGTSPDGRRVVVEIALNHHLLTPQNESALLDTLLHEMAHAADWLVDGRAGHGPSWRAWARRAGCTPRACTTAALKIPGRSRGTGGANRRRPRG